MWLVMALVDGATGIGYLEPHKHRVDDEAAKEIEIFAASFYYPIATTYALYASHSRRAALQTMAVAAARCESTLSSPK